MQLNKVFVLTDRLRNYDRSESPCECSMRQYDDMIRGTPDERLRDYLVFTDEAEAEEQAKRHVALNYLDVILAKQDTDTLEALADALEHGELAKALAGC